MNFNPAMNFAIAQHYEDLDGVINYLVDLFNDDIDPFDTVVFDRVMHHYGLDDDGFESEIDYIIQEVSKRIYDN